MVWHQMNHKLASDENEFDDAQSTDLFISTYRNGSKPLYKQVFIYKK